MFRVGDNSIEVALAKYLLDRDAVTRHVSRRVFIGRRPTDIKQKTAVTIRRIGTHRRYGLAGEIDSSQALLRLQIVARGNNAEHEAYRIFESIRCEISGYRGEWDGTEILQCVYENEGVDLSAPPNKSDEWLYVYGFDARVIHRQKATDLSVSRDPPLETILVLRLSTGNVLRLASGRVLNLK